MQSDKLQSAQNVLALWQEKIEALKSLGALTTCMLQAIDDGQDDDIEADMEKRSALIERMNAIDGKSVVLLRMLSSTPQALSEVIDPSIRNSLEDLRRQMIRELQALQQLDGRLQAAVSNRLTELGDELSQTKSQIIVNKGYNMGETSTFDARS